MPSSPPGSPATAEDGERPWPPLVKMKLAAYAMCRVFYETREIFAVAYVGIYIVLYVVIILALLSPVAERVHFWAPVQLLAQSLFVADTALIICALIRRYILESDPPQQPAAADQLPPPPEMDMC